MPTLIRFRHGYLPAWGRLDGEWVHLLAEASPFEGYTEAGETLPARGLKLLAPAQPTKILAVGINYGSHLQGRPRPEKPELFLKPVSALIGPDEPIALPPDAEDTHFEGELVVVIGKRARHVPVERALEHVFGYTIGNDVSERKWQAGDRQWWRAKGCDTFAPVGPWIVTDLDLGTSEIATEIGGTVAQQGHLSDLIFDVPTVVSFASRYLTLEPGDLIFTGTPGHTRAMQPGKR